MVVFWLASLVGVVDRDGSDLEARIFAYAGTRTESGRIVRKKGKKQLDSGN
jgi:hypothetical protein